MEWSTTCFPFDAGRGAAAPVHNPPRSQKTAFRIKPFLRETTVDNSPSSREVRSQGQTHPRCRPWGQSGTWLAGLTIRNWAIKIAEGVGRVVRRGSETVDGGSHF